MSGIVAPTNNFHELTHGHDSFSPFNMLQQYQSKHIGEEILMNHWNTCTQVPVLVRQSAFADGNNIKTVSSTSHSFLSQNTNMSYDHYSIQKLHNRVLHTTTTPLNTPYKFISKKNNFTSSHEHQYNCEEIPRSKDFSENQLTARIPESAQMHNEHFKKCLNTSVSDTVTVEEGRITRRPDEIHLAPDDKVLRHSIASILSISPKKDNILDNNNMQRLSGSDNSSSIENAIQRKSNNISGLIDDTIVLAVSCNSKEDILEMKLARACTSHNNRGNSIGKRMFNKKQNSSQRETSFIETERSVDSMSNVMLAYDKSLEKRKSEHMKHIDCLKTRESRDYLLKDDISTSSILDKRQLCPEKWNQEIFQNVQISNDIRNVNIPTEDRIHFSQCFSNSIPNVTKYDRLAKFPSTVNPTMLQPRIIPTGHVLPSIDTLCQNYQRYDTEKRSAFKPIEKRPHISTNVPNFLIPCREWGGMNILHNIHQSSNKRNVHSSTIRRCQQDIYSSGQINKNSLNTIYKQRDINVHRHNNKSCQSRETSDAIPQIKSSPSTSEKLPDTWMTWLHHRESDPLKSNHFHERNQSRVPQPPRYHCDACSKTYSTFGGISKHRQFHCAQHVKKEFTCKVCNRAYSSLGALKMHIRTHTLPCRCQECGKAFSRPWLLQGHLRTHSGEKPFKCNNCGRAFADRSNLRAHLQTHADIKRYGCSKCAKTFSRMSLLIKHKDGSCPVTTRSK